MLGVAVEFCHPRRVQVEHIGESVVQLGFLQVDVAGLQDVLAVQAVRLATSAHL